MMKHGIITHIGDNMNIRKRLCDIVKSVKEDRELTYDQIIELGNGAFHKSQLTAILKHNGHNVSVDVVMDVLTSLGVEIEVHETYRSTLPL